MDIQHYCQHPLDAPISYFAPDQQRGIFANVPAKQTTLRRIVTTSYYRPLIEAIRNETDPAKQTELKKQLPAITPVALLHHRKVKTTFDEKIKQQWPLLTGDVDKKDNPGVDMAELKKYIARLPYVLLCAYSVRGGLWFVVRLPDHQTPETLAAHFRYLQRLFGGQKDGKYYGEFGITLDSSKGGNPTDLRFVSYDADPYLNDNATVMAGKYTPPKPKPTPRNNRNYSPVVGLSGERELGRCVRIVENAADGEKNTQLFKAARLAGGYIAGGVLNEETAIAALEDAISKKPDVADFKNAQRTIRAGIENGKLTPLYEDSTYSVLPARAVAGITEKPPPATDARPNNTWKHDGELIHGEVVSVAPCEPDTAQQPDEPPIDPVATSVVNEFTDLNGNKFSIVIGPHRYPAFWDEPNPQGRVPTIREVPLTDAKAFHQWQQGHPYFGRHGLASQKKVNS